MLCFSRFIIILSLFLTSLLDPVKLHAESHNTDLVDTNPDVDFANLIIDNVYSLMAPDPLEPSEEAPSSLCVCDWTISHEMAGAFNPYDACGTQLVIFSNGSGQITVDVDCGNDGDDLFVQDFTSKGAVSPDSSLTGSGCTLRGARMKR